METLDHPHEGLPIRVSLVAFGHNHDLHMKALDMFEGDAWRKLDVGNYLSRDPAAGGVGHLENGSTPTTQICVFSMPEFVDLAVNEYRKIIEERKFARLYGCNRGMHKSDVLVRLLEHALNALKTIDGRQVFEARAFALAEGYGTKGPLNIADSAISWMTKEWGWATPVDVDDLDSIFAYRNVGKVEKSARAWMAMWRYVQERGPELSKSLIDERDAGPPMAKKAPRQAHRQWSSGAGIASGSNTPGNVEQAATAPAPPTRDISTVEEPRPCADGREAADRESLIENRAVRMVDKMVQTERVQWDRWGPATWHHILRDAGCDQLAIDTFMLMAQLPHDEAKCHSNQIMSYLQCKDVRDASRLVHRWAIDARKKVLSKMEYQMYIDTRRWDLAGDRVSHNAKCGTDASIAYRISIVVASVVYR